MADTGTITIDIGEISKESKVLARGISNVKDKVSELKANLTAQTEKLNISLKDVQTEVKNIGDRIATSVSDCASDVTSSVKNVQSVTEQIAEEVKKNAVIEAISIGSDVSSILVNITDIFGKMSKDISTGKPGKADVTEKDKQMKTTETVMSTSEKNKGSTSTNDDLTKSGVVSSLAGMDSFLPDLQSITEMKEAMSDLISTIKESVVQWGRQTLAKAKDRAEDLKIIALNAVEHVKAFGLMIGQLIASAAAWVSETAAKVANTVATWASVAATTAWQGICIAATAVTTAFGAAMNFLTSPIGLVVLAVGALIAIVVLLVKNWDTVKAAALSVWETIKEAFGSAWKWFKDTVLDPLVNGFKGMVNGVIGFLNGLIAGIVKGINGVIGLLNKLKFDIPDWVPGLGGQTFGFNIKPLSTPQIPLLAQGAVLPANKPFLAVVGDQKHGTNVEAPLDTIKQVMAEVLAGQGSGDVVINFTGDLAQLARVLKPVIDRENRRVGVSLAKGVV